MKLTDEEKILIEYCKEHYPQHKKAESFEDVKYQEFTAAQVLSMLRRIKNHVR